MKNNVTLARRFGAHLGALGRPALETDTRVEEPAFTAYQPQHVTTWTNAILFQGTATSWADPCLWVTGAVGTYPVTVLGYYVTDGESTYLLWCEMAPAPVVLTGAGQSVVVQPRIQWGALPGS